MRFFSSSSSSQGDLNLKCIVDCCLTWTPYGLDCCGAAYPLQEGKCPPALRSSFHLPVCLSAYLPICLSSYHPTCLSANLPICLSSYLPIGLSDYLPIWLSVYIVECTRFTKVGLFSLWRESQFS